MNKLLNFLYVLLVLGLLAVAINEEFKLSSFKIDDITKVLMLMCLIVVVIKSKKMENFRTYYETIDPENEKKKCGYDNMNLFKDSFDPNDFCKYEGRKDPSCSGDHSKCDIPLKESVIYQYPNSFRSGDYVSDGTNKASLDGSDDLKNQSLFTFSNNETSLECCPGIYSSSGGCVCPNKKQNQFIQTRGGNRTHPSEF